LNRLGGSHRMLDIAMARIGLQPGVVTPIGKGVAAGMRGDVSKA
jgi:hypothetical protein